MQQNVGVNAGSGADDVVNVYPTKPDANGWYYEDEQQEVMGMETRVDADGMEFKRVQLTRGRFAVLRQLTAKDKKQAEGIAGKNKGMVMAAYIAVCASIFDKAGMAVGFVAEDVDSMLAKDVNRLEMACSMLNF